jgi:hypothetical protein
MITETYLTQHARWPQSGRHILAQFDDQSIVVYQAYRPAIGHFAASNGFFGGEFSLSRTSWIKPNFLWMMYRSAWGTAEGQEVVLAIRIKRDAFDTMLAQAIPSTFDSTLFADHSTWKRALHRSDVVMQWDPDHLPSGHSVKRRALQLGLRGAALARFAQEWIVEISDISEFVAEQRALAHAREYARLMLPQETVYPMQDAALAARLGLASWPE